MADELDGGIRKLRNAYGGGLLVAIPGLILTAVGAPLWLTITYLCVLVVVLGVIALRRRGDRRA